jgi:hypothetical protein
LTPVTSEERIETLAETVITSLAVGEVGVLAAGITRLDKG